MAIRTIRTMGDEILEKKCRTVEEMTARTKDLIDDMLRQCTRQAESVSAPQVGILKRIVVIDTDGTPYVLINPEIIETSGTQTGQEGCLSLPGKYGIVTRPNYVKVRAYDENMNLYELEGTELLARAICHECEHLDGILYVEAY